MEGAGGTADNRKAVCSHGACRWLWGESGGVSLTLLKPGHPQAEDLGGLYLWQAYGLTGVAWAGTLQHPGLQRKLCLAKIITKVCYRSITLKTYALSQLIECSTLRFNFYLRVPLSSTKASHVALPKIPGKPLLATPPRSLKPSNLQLNALRGLSRSYRKSGAPGEKELTAERTWATYTWKEMWRGLCCDSTINSHSASAAGFKSGHFHCKCPWIAYFKNTLFHSFRNLLALCFFLSPSISLVLLL